MSRIPGFIVPVLASFLIMPSLVTAQAVGTLAGTITGPDGARLPGVTVVVAGPSGETRVITGNHGGYLVTGLLPGAYNVRAELPGFRGSEIRAVQFTGAETVTVDLALALAALQDAVKVTGSAPADSLEAPRINESGARDVGDALTGVAGIWKIRKAAIANDLVLRGYQGDNVSVLIDGMRLYGACPGHMDRTAFHVDFAEVERVDVAKGPFDLRNQGSLGGAVNIVTKRPDEGLHATPGVTIGSYGYLNPSVTASAGNRRIAALGGYSFRSSDAYTDGRGESMLAVANYRDAAYDEKAFSINTGWARVDVAPADGHAAQVSYTAQRADLILYPYLRMDAIYDNADRVNTGYDFTKGVGKVAGIRAQGYYSRVKHFMTDQFRTSAPPSAERPYSMGTLASTETTGGKVEATWSNGFAGVEAYSRFWGTEGYAMMSQYRPAYALPDVTINAVGVYVEHAVQPSAAWRLDLGARYDHASSAADLAKANTDLYYAYHDTRAIEATDDAPSAKARLTWQPTADLTLSGGVGLSARVPDAQERFYAVASMGTDWVGNPTLATTSNVGLDATVTYKRPRLSLNASAYRDDLRDFVTVYSQKRVHMPAMTMPGMGMAMPAVNTLARSFANVDATMTGAEVEGVVSLTERVFLAGDVSGVRGRQAPFAASGITSANLAEIPPMRSRLSLRYDARKPRGGYFMEAEGVYSAAQDHVNADVLELATPGYFVANARAGVQMGAAQVTVGIANLLDRAYVEHLSYQRDPYRSGVRVYEPGRNIYALLNVRF